MTTPIDPIGAALVVARHLDAPGILHTVGGSIASSLAGEPLSTVDIDVVAALEERHVLPLVSALSAGFHVDAEALRRAIRARTSTNLAHRATQPTVDLFVVGNTPLDEQQLARRLPVDLDGGRRLHVHPPEDVLLRKLRWYRRGGETSDRQWRDIAAIARVQDRRLDRDDLRDNAEVPGVSDLLARALAEAPGEECSWRAARPTSWPGRGSRPRRQGRHRASREVPLGCRADARWDTVDGQTSPGGCLRNGPDQAGRAR